MRRSRIDSGGSVGVAGLGVARIAVGVFLPVSAQGLIEHLVAERTFNSEEGAVVADRMVGPGGTGDSSKDLSHTATLS